MKTDKVIRVAKAHAQAVYLIALAKLKREQVKHIKHNKKRESHERT